MSFLDNLKAAFQVRPTDSLGAPVEPVNEAPKPALTRPAPATGEDVRAAFEVLLKLREGCRNVVYKDIRGFPTVGIGHLVRPEDGLKVGDKITDAQVDALFMKDSQGAWDHAVAQAKQAGITSQNFLPYLASVCFQLGGAWTAKFPNTWGMICQGRYAQASAALLGTAWHTQTPSRVTDFQGALLRLPPKARA